MLQQRNIYTVQQLIVESKNLLESCYPDIWIEGEISDLASPPSGHRYFSLKDANAVLRCVLFRKRSFQASSPPVEGMQLLARGRLSVYPARGDIQFVVSYLEEAGEGALRRAFEVLKRKLAEEGLFAAERKRQLLPLPRRIGIITSSQGAALHDVLVTLKRRYPPANVLLYPVTVQGETAAAEIAAALEVASTRQEVDLLLLVRGGGSLQDLQAFNDESVARAVSVCKVPVVTGVGHETDFTVVDFVSDLRAPTPTGAAEAATPDVHELLNRLRTQRGRLTQSIKGRLTTLQQRLDLGSGRLAHPQRKMEYWVRHHHQLQHRLWRTMNAAIGNHRLRLQGSAGALRQLAPQHRLVQLQQQLGSLARRLHQNHRYRFRDNRRALDALSARLQALSPQNILERGYAIVTADEGKRVIRRADEVTLGDSVRARLANGELICEVEDVLD